MTEWAPGDPHDVPVIRSGASSNDSAGSEGEAGSSGGSSGVDTSDVSDFSPGFNPDRQLSSLTDAGIDTLCSRGHNYFVGQVRLAEYERAICYYDSGASGALSKGECYDLVDSCLTTTTFDYLACSLETLKGEDGCAAEVDAYAGCLTERAAIAKAAVEYWDCDRPEDAEKPQQLTVSPRTCDALWALCPQLR